MELSDPQVWTLIGVFTTMMLGGVRAEMNARLDAIDLRLTRVETKVDDFDKELTNLATRFWRSQ